jgi:hypothetical protein
MAPGMDPGTAPGAALGGTAPWVAPHAVQVLLPSGRLFPQVWQKLIVSLLDRSMAGGWRHIFLPWQSSVHKAIDTVLLFIRLRLSGLNCVPNPLLGASEHFKYQYRSSFYCLLRIAADGRRYQRFGSSGSDWSAAPFRPAGRCARTILDWARTMAPTFQSRLMWLEGRVRTMDALAHLAGTLFAGRLITILISR